MKRTLIPAALVAALSGCQALETKDEATAASLDLMSLRPDCATRLAELNAKMLATVHLEPCANATAADGAARQSALAEMGARAADPDEARAYVLQASMI